MDTRLHTHHFHAMGTACELQLRPPPGANAEAVAGLAIAEVNRLEQRYSRYRPHSDLSAINRCAAAGGACTVDAETAALLNYAQACHQQSGGLFDISSGLLRRAWRFDAGRLPTPDELEPLRARIGWHRVQWQAPQLVFPEPGMELDFGGIVKEYAVDRVATLLQQAGVQHGYVNLGGDLRVIGPQPDGTPWHIGIRHPRDPQALLARVPMHGGALASSGDYERCIVANGVRHGHILNPRTGWPVRTLAAVSVMAPLCVVAGSAATIAMLMEAEGPAWLQAGGLPHAWVDVAGRGGGNLPGLSPA